MMDEVDSDAAPKDLKDTGEIVNRESVTIADSEIVNRECVTVADIGKEFFTCNND